MLRLLRLRQVVIAAAVGVSSCLGGGQSPRLLWVASCLGRQGGCGRWPRLRLWPLTGGRSVGRWPLAEAAAGGQLSRLLWVASCLGCRSCRGCGQLLRRWWVPWCPVALAVAASVSYSEMRVVAAMGGGWLHQLWWVTSCSRQLQGGIAGMSSGGFSF